MVRTVGYISERVAQLVGNIQANSPILLGDSNLAHMQLSHPAEFSSYFNQLENILAAPDYLNINPDDNSIRYIKILNENVVVGVRISARGQVFARTIYTFSEEKFQRFLHHGYLIPAN